MVGGEEEWEEIRPEEAEIALAEEEIPVAEELPVAEGEAPTEPAAPAHVDRSRYALVSGLGFFVLGLVVYLFVVLPGDPALAALSAAGMALTAAAVYFWMADDLRLRPRNLSRSALRFIAGPLLGLLALVGLATLVTFLGPGEWGKAATVFLLEFGTAATVSLLFYSLLWMG